MRKVSLALHSRVRLRALHFGFGNICYSEAQYQRLRNTGHYRHDRNERELKKPAYHPIGSLWRLIVFSAYMTHSRLHHVFTWFGKLLIDGILWVPVELVRAIFVSQAFKLLLTGITSNTFRVDLQTFDPTALIHYTNDSAQSRLGFTDSSWSILPLVSYPLLLLKTFYTEIKWIYFNNKKII